LDGSFNDNRIRAITHRWHSQDDDPPFFIKEVDGAAKNPYDASLKGMARQIR
jgi:hypothetical protein